MARIIPLRRNAHQEAQRLLPWYATDRLDAADKALVEAHLGGCPQCQADLRFERRLGSEIAALPFETEEAWTRLKARMNSKGRWPSIAGWVQGARRGMGRTPPWLGWALAAQAVILIAGAVIAPSLPPGAVYRTLGSAAESPAGNVLVIFRPETPERRLRGAITQVGARLVDGPTDADAYVLHVAPARRQQALAILRARGDILMAQPIGGEGAP